MYTHMEEAPKVVFYDYACNLNEYVKNRESGFFKNTRFYHDIFHGYTHKCSTVFRCSGLNGFEQTNTSICEQFNSYIKRIKASARLLSQAHFTFYLQFFIDQWNNMQNEGIKKKNYSRRLGNLDTHPSENEGLYS